MPRLLNCSGGFKAESSCTSMTQAEDLATLRCVHLGRKGLGQCGGTDQQLGNSCQDGAAGPGRAVAARHACRHADGAVWHVYWLQAGLAEIKTGPRGERCRQRRAARAELLVMVLLEYLPVHTRPRTCMALDRRQDEVLGTGVKLG